MAKAQDINEHMEVIGSDGAHVGTVDCTKDEDKIVLTKGDPKSGGQHHVIPISWVDHIDTHVHLNKSSKDAFARWQAAA